MWCKCKDTIIMENCIIEYKVMACFIMVFSSMLRYAVFGGEGRISYIWVF